VTALQVIVLPFPICTRSALMLYVIIGAGAAAAAADVDDEKRGDADDVGAAGATLAG